MKLQYVKIGESEKLSVMPSKTTDLPVGQDAKATTSNADRKHAGKPISEATTLEKKKLHKSSRKLKKNGK